MKMRVTPEKDLENYLERGVINRPMFDWLIANHFGQLPASTKFHGAFEGGLFNHSVAVANTLKGLTDSLNLSWEDPLSPERVGLLHDLCKVGKYRRVDDSWNSEGVTVNYHYEYTPTAIPGHGLASAIIAQQHMGLTDEEVMCIIHHMGAYETAEWDKFDAAIKLYPNVLFTHTADMIASKILEV